jgi:hypothetical protein
MFYDHRARSLVVILPLSSVSKSNKLYGPTGLTSSYLKKQNKTNKQTKSYWEEQRRKY